MWHVCLFLLLQPALMQETKPSSPIVTGERAQLDPPTYHTGPLHCELTALYDARYWFLDQSGNTRSSELQLRWRVSGKRIMHIARHGNLILSEAVDDTGKSLIGPDTYTDEQRTQMRAPRLPPSRLRFSGLELPSRIATPSRAARTLKLRGSVRLILAKDREEISIDKPLDYVGKTLEHKRLQELGIEIRVVKPNQLAGKPLNPSQCFVLQYVRGKEHVQEISLVDAWMKSIRWHKRAMETKQGDAVDVHTVSKGKISEDCQIVLKLLPKIDEVELPVEIDGLELP